MPGYRAHIFCAILMYAVMLLCISALVTSGWIVMGGLCAIIAGALFPDIDIKSKGQHYLYWIYAATLGLLLLLHWRSPKQLWIDLIICLAVLTIAPMLGRHRGITHAPLFILALGAIFWIITAGFYPQYTAHFFFYSCCFVFGALSHIWLDKRRIFFFK
jgi:LexA-binding, inner membrane-associated putative hydrolase